MHLNMARRSVLVLAAAGIALGTAAYASSASATTNAPRTHSSPGAVTPLKVALVAPSATNDLSWTQTIYAALESLKSSQHLTVSVSANEYVTSDAANILREYASDGYNLVIAHGSQYGSTIEQLAPEFPKVSFAWGTAASTFGKPNIFAYEAAANEGGYVEGYMAAMLSKTHVLGVCGPIATGDDKLYIDGYVAGAKAERKSIVVHAVYTGSYSDDSLMATCAKTFVADRVDVLSATTQSAVGAIGVARNDKLPWFGNDWSMASLAPKNVVATQVYNWDSVLEQMFAAIRGGTLGGATYVIGLGNGGEKVDFNSAYKLSPAIKAQGEKLITEITDGDITVPQ
ncbi:MAG: BMP family protein [Acidimicrobiales bacterium]|jgi:basic membrane protein A